MPPETADRTAVLLSGLEALQRHDLEACVALLTPGFVINIAGMPAARRGAEAWRRNAAMMLTAVPDLRIDVEDVVAQGDRVAVRLQLSGTHQGELMGLRPTGRPVSWASTEVYRFEGGLIAEEWICSDTLTMLEQLGGVSSARLGAMYLSGHRLWLGAAGGAAAGLLLPALLRRVRPGRRG